MKLLPASNSIPAWQTERANRLHRACLRFDRLVDGGMSRATAANKVAWYYHQETLRSDPSRRLKLTPQTLRRWHGVWLANGKSPVALKLKYRMRCPFMPAPLLVRFANFCASNRLPSVRIAWQIFSARKQNGRAREFTYGQVTYSFASTDFYLMQAQLKAIEKAQAKLDRVRLKAIVEITERLSERPPRRRVNLVDAYQI